jgi:hypothetical protein
MVSGFIASVKVALTAWFRGTAVAAFTGTVDTISGETMALAAPVVKVQTQLPASLLQAIPPFSAVPAKS